jgi:hypothetical protein
MTNNNTQLTQYLCSDAPELTALLGLNVKNYKSYVSTVSILGVI